MARASSVSRPRGYKPYAYRELEEFHLKQLRQFLRFLYSELDNDLRFWGDLIPLIFDRPVMDPVNEFRKMLVPKGEPTLLGMMSPAWESGEYVWFLKNLKKEFSQLVREAEKSRGFLVSREAYHLQLSQLPGVEDVYYYSSVNTLRFDKPKDVLQILLRSVAKHLHGLRKDALRTCEVCQRYFLRSDIREARYCSANCRYRAIDQRRKGRRASGKKKA